MNRKYDIEEILEAGMNVVREKGYHHTGINDILKASGIPKGSFYNFFRSKEEFGLRLLEYYSETMLSHMHRYLDNHSRSPLQRLENFYRFVIGVNADEDCRQGCLLNNMSSEVGGNSEPIARQAHQQFSRWMETLSACILEGQEEGEIRKDYPAQELAEFMHTSFFGALTRSKMMRDIGPLNLTFQMAFDFVRA